MKPTLHSHLPNVISVLSHFNSTHTHTHTHTLRRSPVHVLLVCVFSLSTWSRCAQDFAHQKTGVLGEGSVAEERGGGGGCAICPTASAAVNTVTSAGRRQGDGCADYRYRLHCVSRRARRLIIMSSRLFLNYDNAQCNVSLSRTHKHPRTQSAGVPITAPIAASTAVRLRRPPARTLSLKHH